MTAIYSETRIAKVPNGAVLSEVRGATLLLALQSGRYFTLNGTARAIWDALEAGPTHGELVDRLCELYDVSRTTCQAEVRSILNDFRDLGIVTFET